MTPGISWLIRSYTCTPVLLSNNQVQVPTVNNSETAMTTISRTWTTVEPQYSTSLWSQWPILYCYSQENIAGTNGWNLLPTAGLTALCLLSKITVQALSLSSAAVTNGSSSLAHASGEILHFCWSWAIFHFLTVIAYLHQIHVSISQSRLMENKNLHTTASSTNFENGSMFRNLNLNIIFSCINMTSQFKLAVNIN